MMNIRSSKRLKARLTLSSEETSPESNLQENVNSVSEQPSEAKVDPVGAVFSTPEILEKIVAHLNLGDQKSCRRVCKVWNHEVCRVFRQSRVAVSVQDTHDTTGERSLSTLLATVKTGKEFQLPSPFSKDLAVAFDLKYVESALDKIKALPFSVIALKFLIEEFDETMNIEVMQGKAVHAIPLIQHCAPTLTHLTTPAWESERTFTELKLPELKRLTALFKVFYSGDEFTELVYGQVNFFLQCLDGAPKLEEFYIDGESSTSEEIKAWRNYPSSYISNFLTAVNLSMIQVLSLDFYEYDNAYDISVVENTLECLKTVEIPQLKRLRVARLVGYSRLWTIRLALEVIAQFSESLQEFSTNLYVHRPCEFPYCPNLRKVVFEAEVRFKYLDFSNLPSLKRIELEAEIKRDQYFRGPPVTTVETIGIGSTWSWTGDGDPQPWQFDKYFNTLFEWFPKVRTWEVSDRYLKSELPEYMKRRGIENHKIRTPKDVQFPFKRTLTHF